MIYLSIPRDKTDKIWDRIRSNENRLMGQETATKSNVAERSE